MHTRLDQVRLQIEHDMVPDALGNRRFRGGVYRLKMARPTIRMSEGDSFLAGWCRNTERKLGITIAYETLHDDEVLMTVKWVSRRVPA